MLSSGVAQAESQLDAEYSDLSTMRASAVVTSDSAAAELFRSRSTGKLDKVSVYLGQNGTGTPTGDVIASIQTVTYIVDPIDGWESWEPSGTELGRGSIPAEGNVSTDGSFSWVDIPLSQPAPVEANQSLALVLETTSGSSGYTWGAGSESIYCGEWCLHPAQVQQNGTWQPFPSANNFFKSYVDAPSDTTPPDTTITSKRPRQ